MRKIVVKDISEINFKKIMKRKDEDGFGDKSWEEWLTFLGSKVRLKETLHEQIQRGTRQNLLKTWMQNFAQNLESGMLKNDTIEDLIQNVETEDMRRNLEENDASPLGTAVVIGAGVL